MGIPNSVLIVGGAAILVVIVAIVLYILRARTINLTQSKTPGEKPEWMQSTPPAETMAATQAEGEGITVYNFDAGEKIAAPFVEQIEDILHARMKTDPSLSGITVDLGSSPDGELEIWVNGEKYTEIEQVPNMGLRQAFQYAVEEWQQRQ